MANRRVVPDVNAIRELPVLASQVIPAEWEDQNGHVNVGFYMTLYNKTGWPLFDLIGIDERYFSARRMGIVDLDNHIRYLNELHVGDRVTAYGRFLAHDSKRLHGMVFVVNDETDVLSSTIEFLSINIDLDARKATPVPDDVAARLRALTETHQTLSWTVPACMSISD
jgi:acyl-CoA thioester hydrolase